MINAFDDAFIQYDLHAKHYQLNELHEIIESVYKLSDQWVLEFEDVSLSSFLDQNKIVVKCFDGISDTLPYRALFKQNGSHYLILVNRLSIESIQKQTGLTYDQIYLLHVYHELFHYLEEKRGHVYDCVQSKKVRFRTKKLYKLSEIGAFRFSQILSKVPFHPYSLDQ